MIDFPILAMAFILNLIAVLFVICCVALILIILVQKGKGGGLSSAFGGGMSGGILGTKTGDFLTWVTIVLVSIMLLFAIILAKYYRPAASGTPGASGVPVSAPQESTRPLPGSTTGQTNNTTGNGSPLKMNEGTEMTEPETPVGNTVEAEKNTNEASDSNQTGN